MAANPDEEEGHERAYVPETIIGIGQGGKEVVKTLLDQDWILREALEPRPGDENPGFNPVIIDSETSQGNRDEVVAENYSQRLKEKAEEFGHNAPNTELKQFNIIEEAQEQDPGSLVAPGPVRRIAGPTGLRSWWLEYGDGMLSSNDDFSEGVERRRALSKAFYHSTRAAGDPVGQVINNPGSATYIVVGLGGGTGSGAFLDIAKEIDEKQGTNVHLVGILPGKNAGSQEDANTYAALSELEYLSLTEQLPFSSVMLVPYAPATDTDDFDEAVVNGIMSHANITNNAPGPIMNHTQHFEPGGSLVKRFAPFTLMVPKTFHINAPEIEEAEDEIATFYESLEDALDTEEELYRKTKRLFRNPGEFDLTEGTELDDAHLPDGVIEARNRFENDNAGYDDEATEFNLDKAEADALFTRMTRTRELLDEDIFDQLGFVGPDKVREKYEDSKDDVEADFDRKETQYKEALIHKVARKFTNLTHDNLLSHADQNIDQKDRELTQQLVREFRMIGERAKILRAAHLVTDEKDLRKGIQEAVGLSAEMFDEISDAVEKKDDLTTTVDQLSSVTDTLEEAHEEAQSKMEEELEDWRKEARPDVEKLLKIDSNEDDIEALIDDLKNAIDQAINDLKRGGNVPQQPLDFDSFSELNRKLKEVDIDGVPDRKIKTSMKALAAMRRAKEDDDDDDDGLLSGLLGGNDDGRDPQERFERELNNVDRELFEVKPPRFDASFEPEFVGETRLEAKKDELANEREDRVDSIVDTLESYVQEPFQFEETVSDPSDARRTNIEFGFNPHQQEYQEDLEDELEDLRNDRTAGEILRELTDDEGGNEIDNVVREGIRAATVGIIEERKEEKENEYEEKQTTLALFRIVEHIANEEGQELVYNQPSDIEFSVEFDEGENGQNPHKDTMSPKEWGQLVGHEDAADAGLFDIDSEYSRLRGRFGNHAETISSGAPIAPIKQPTLKRPGNRGRIGESNDGSTNGTLHYESQPIRSVFLSRAYDDSEGPPGSENYHYENVKQNLEGGVRFPDDKEGYSEITLKYGSPWDVTMTTFVGGIFLDNLKPVGSSQDGYGQSYTEQQDEYGETIRFRHTHAVDGRDRHLDLDFNEGAYIRRDRVLNVNSREGDLFTIGDEDEISEKLLDLINVTRFNSPVELEERSSSIDIGE